jgi:hypothetical protein
MRPDRRSAPRAVALAAARPVLAPVEWLAVLAAALAAVAMIAAR